MIESTSGGIKFPDGTTQSTALGMSANTFASTVTISTGNLALPSTAGASSGVLTLGGASFLHAGGATTYPNTYLGLGAGSFGATGSGGNVAVGYQAMAGGVGRCLQHGRGNVGPQRQYVRRIECGDRAGGTLSKQHRHRKHRRGICHTRLSHLQRRQFRVRVVCACQQHRDGTTAHSARPRCRPRRAATSIVHLGTRRLVAIRPASGNSAFGYQTMLSATTGANNTAFGYQALKANVSSGENAAFGYQAGAQATSQGNSSFGTYALINATTGGWNTAIGRFALAGVVTGNNNIGIGDSTLQSAGASSGNTAVGLPRGPVPGGWDEQHIPRPAGKAPRRVPRTSATPRRSGHWQWSHRATRWR